MVLDLQQAAQLAQEHRQAGRLAEAEAICRQLILQRPDLAEVHHELGSILLDQKRFAESIAAYRQSIQLLPDQTGSHYGLGLALTECGEYEPAMDEFRESIRLRPDWADAHFCYAENLLRVGDYQRGWEEYEWRSRTEEAKPYTRKFSQPRWNGRPLKGWTILLHGEQGFGDRLQFARYAPMVASQGGRVILECLQEQMRLFRTLKGISQFLIAGRQSPKFDVHCPLPSLPLVFGTRTNSIPAEVPYLGADAQLVNSWTRRLELDRSRLNVGLAWSGGIRTKMYHQKSMAFSQLAPLAQVRGVRFYSLQKGPSAAEAGHPPEGMDLIDVTKEFEDFADTAALIANLDLVISVDTAVVHLAGAMGKPVWTMLPFVPDWRWLLDREDSPWYPTMRLFRQNAIGDWAGVVRHVAEELAKWRK